MPRRPQSELRQQTMHRVGKGRLLSAIPNSKLPRSGKSGHRPPNWDSTISPWYGTVSEPILSPFVRMSGDIHWDGAHAMPGLENTAAYFDRRAEKAREPSERSRLEDVAKHYRML